MKEEHSNNIPESKDKPAKHDSSTTNKNKKIVHELTTKNLILLADMENLRKRLENEKQDLLKYGSMSLLQDLLPFLDMLDEALKSNNVSEETKKWLMGFEMIVKSIFQILEKEGIKRIPLTVGQVFDHNYHYAIEQQNSETIEANHVISISQNGYTLFDRLIRPAFVVVSLGKKAETEEQKEEIDENLENEKQSKEEN